MSSRSTVPTLVLALTAGAFLTCQPAEDMDAGDAEAGASASRTEAGVVEVIARDYAFEAPATLPSGWTTIRLVNEGAEPHFVLLDRLPEGVTFRQFLEEAGTAFDSVWYQLRDGSVDKAEAGQMLGSVLPEWYFSTVQTGGTGIVMPGETASVTLRLEPGDYVMECYVKTPEGEFHVTEGMASPLTVTADSSAAEPPEADLEIALTNEDISVTGSPASGEQTVAVHFEEHPEVGLGNDVHLVRLEGETSAEEVAPWMDWMNVDGLRPPAPARFLGGTQEMPVGQTAYFTVELEAGRYAWISESPAARGLFTEFTVE